MARFRAAMAILVLAALVPGAPTAALTPAPTPENALPSGLELALPWPTGQSETIGWAYDQCATPRTSGDHCNQDRFALDFGTDVGTDVLAAAPGTVLYAGQATEGYRCLGWIVVLDHPVPVDGATVHLQTLYSDLQPTTDAGGKLSLGVTTGQPVGRGTYLGESGATGCSGEPHVHFVVYREGTICLPVVPGGPPNGCVNDGVGLHDGIPVIPEPLLGAERYEDLASGRDLLSTTTPADGCGSAPATEPPAGTPVSVVGTWVAPDDCSMVSGPLTLTAHTETIEDVEVASVRFSARWTDGAADLCTADAPVDDGTWSCDADLALLGIPLGAVTLTFDVFDDAGGVVHAADGEHRVTLAGGTPRASWHRSAIKDARHVPYGSSVALAARVSSPTDLAEVRFTAWYPDWPVAKDAAKVSGFDAGDTPAVLAICTPSGGTNGCRWDGDARSAVVSWSWDPTAGQAARVAPEVPRARAAMPNGEKRCVPVTFGIIARDRVGAAGSSPEGGVTTRCDRLPAGDGRRAWLDPLAKPDRPSRATIKLVGIPDCTVLTCVTDYRITWTPVDGATGYEVWTEHAWFRWKPGPQCLYEQGLDEPQLLARVDGDTTSIQRSFTPELRDDRIVYGSRYTVRAVNAAGSSAPRIVGSREADGIRAWADVGDCESFPFPVP